MTEKRQTLRVEVEVPCGEAESAAFLLSELGCPASMEEPGRVQGMTRITANFPASADSPEGLGARIEAAFSGFPGLRGASPAISAEDSGDWERSFRQIFAPFQIAPSLTVVPSWEIDRYRCAGEIIELDPGMAFGTGLHETTRMCAEAIAELADRSNSLLDIGTGSGILAIAARKLGIARICAVENDPEAIEVARKNFVKNGCPDIELLPSLESAAGGYGIVAANILLAPLLDMKDEIAKKVCPDGRLVLSGITGDQEQYIQDAYDPLLDRVSVKRLGEWSAVIYGRS